VLPAGLDWNVNRVYYQQLSSFDVVNETI
jgi:hypothetical protein